MKKKLNNPVKLLRGILSKTSGTSGPITTGKNGVIRIRFKNVPIKRKK